MCVYVSRLTTTTIAILSKARNFRFYKNGNLCKGTFVGVIIGGSEVDARVEQQKRPAGFYRMSVMVNLLCFGCFAAG